MSPCRLCGAAGLKVFLELGSMPLANALRRPEELGTPEDTFPLDVALCEECGLAQLTETVDPKRMFVDYPYFSSYSDTMVDSARGLVDRLVKEKRLDADSFVVEPASNDGYLLQFYVERGIPVLGIEPAENIAAYAEEKVGIPTLVKFFGAELARVLVAEGRRADVMHANNVLAHVPDPNDFVEGISILLAEEGTLVVEVPHVYEMIVGSAYDTVYHEHFSYFSTAALDRLFGRHGLRLVDVERIPIHGGSLRVFVARADSAQEPQPAVRRLLDEERRLGVDTLEFYDGFQTRVTRHGQVLRSLLEELRYQGRVIAAYGASAKGTILLNACGIGRETISFVVDRSPVKQGLFLPGSELPVVEPERLLEVRPDVTMLLAWNFADEILSQQADYRARGGRFLVPVPEPRMI
ncbi:MAG: methyltransferase domain-containing protein [Actinomycetota bacterium]